MTDTTRKKIKSYVLRAGRLSNLQRSALERLSDIFCIPYRSEYINYHSVFGNDNPVILEIGFGMGHATADIAENYIDNNYLGIEVHSPGVGKLLSEIEKRKISNLRIVQHDAVDVISNMILEKSLQGVHIFFPDPWPKKKHHKRRLLNRQFVKSLITRLCPGGYIYAVSDWDDYSFQMLDVLNSFPELKNPYKGFAEGMDWRPVTSFEKKGMDKNHKIREIWTEVRKENKEERKNEAS